MDETSKSATPPLPARRPGSPPAHPDAGRETAVIIAVVAVSFLLWMTHPRLFVVLFFFGGVGLTLYLFIAVLRAIYLQARGRVPKE